MTEITVRRMAFEYPEDLDPVFIEGEPEESYANIGFSLLLPYLEPYLIRTMKAARERVTDPALARDLKAFALQEGQHFAQHAQFNRLIQKHGSLRLEALEAEMQADYERFSEEKPLEFNLAYAEGFEALTSAMALMHVRRDNSKWDPAVLRLFEWHLVEELEHRTVAFDVYEHVAGSWPRRVRVGWFAQWHLLGYIRRVAEALIEASPEVIARHGGQRAHRRRMRVQVRRLLFEILPCMLRSHLPWYTPRALVMPRELDALRDKYTGAATHTMQPEL